MLQAVADHVTHSLSHSCFSEFCGKGAQLDLLVRFSHRAQLRAQQFLPRSTWNHVRKVRGFMKEVIECSLTRALAVVLRFELLSWGLLL